MNNVLKSKRLSRVIKYLPWVLKIEKTGYETYRVDVPELIGEAMLKTGIAKREILTYYGEISRVRFYVGDMCNNMHFQCGCCQIYFKGCSKERLLNILEGIETAANRKLAC